MKATTLPQLLERAWACAPVGREVAERDSELKQLHRLLQPRLARVPKSIGNKFLPAGRLVARDAELGGTELWERNHGTVVISPVSPRVPLVVACLTKPAVVVVIRLRPSGVCCRPYKLVPGRERQLGLSMPRQCRRGADQRGGECGRDRNSVI
jgi:hypothetical protein